jgi:hypothetical protein
MTLDQDRQAAMMRTDGMSYRAIGEALGITDKTAKAAVERFRKNAGSEEREDQKRLTAFHRWIEIGRQNGWLGCVLAVIGRERRKTENVRIPERRK